MSGSQSETLTAALRRLADEHASGVLEVAAEPHAVLVELDEGVPVAIGPVEGDAEGPVAAATTVDRLLDRTVTAIIAGDGAWTWDVAHDEPCAPLPPGMASELSRRAVDAAQALSLLPAATVLLPGRPLTAHGTVGRVLDLVDGERTLEEIADTAGASLATTATLALALVRAGAVMTEQAPTTPRSWSQAVAEDATDEDEDEPELWVMDAPAAEPEPEPRPEPEPGPEEPGPGPEPVADPAPVREPTAARTSAAEPVAPSAAEEAGWDDASWFDDLSEQAPRTSASEEPGAAPDEASRRDDARAALSAMLDDFGAEQPRTGAPEPQEEPPGPAGGPTAEDEQDPSADEQDPAGDDDAGGRGLRRGRPRAAPGEVAEFLRELSRLALDDD